MLADGEEGVEGFGDALHVLLQDVAGDQVGDGEEGLLPGLLRGHLLHQLVVGVPVDGVGVVHIAAHGQAPFVVDVLYCLVMRLRGGREGGVLRKERGGKGAWGQ